MARSPKGTVIHHWPSFRLRQMASGGIELGAIALGDSVAFGLYNDSQDGNWLVLWDFKMHYYPSDSGGAVKLVDMGHMQGNNGNPLVKGSPLVGLQGSLDGATFFEHNYQDHTDDFMYLVGTAGTFDWNHDWPMGAIPPGMSLVAIADGEPITTILVNFIWEVTPSI